MKSLFFFLTSSPLFALTVGGSINLSSGYRLDIISLKGKTQLGVLREDKITELKGWESGVDGTLRLDNWYQRVALKYQKIFATPQFHTSFNGYSEPLTPLKKRYGISGTTALGYLFKLAHGKIHLGPEGGFAYQRLNTSVNAYEAAASPFAGLQFLWEVPGEWSIDFGLDFHFLGYRRSLLVSETLLSFRKITKATYYGPEVRLGCDYSITSHWSIGAAGFFKYLKTTRCDLPAYFNTTQYWMTGGALITGGYTF